MKISAVVLLAVTVVACVVQPARVDSDSEIAGTYELIICKTACSFSNRDNVIAKADIVFLDHMMSLEEAQHINPLYNADTRDSNACYTVERSDEAKTYAGVRKTDTSRWLISGNTIKFDLFRSPDAGYAAEVKRTGSSLLGTGESWGVGMGAPPKDYGPDIIVGRRVGPPDISVCKANGAAAEGIRSLPQFDLGASF
jgi:hypothetical protein